MVFETLSLRDRIVNTLSITSGEGLEMTTHINTTAQMELFMEEVALSYLGSKYATMRAEKMMRLACSWQGSSRQELVEIGKTPEYGKRGAGGIEDF